MKIVDQVAGARGRGPEQIRALDERFAEPAQQGAALLQSDQRILSVDLKMARERGGVDPCQPSRVDPPWPTGIGGERSRAKHIETRNGKPFGAREREPACTFAVTPALAGAGIEENAHRRQVSGDARALNRVPIDALRERVPTVDPAGGKMPPATVTGNVQIGIGLAGDGGHVISDCCEAGLVEGEMRRAALGHPITDQAATLAHRGGGVELGNCAQHSPPLIFPALTSW